MTKENATICETPLQARLKKLIAADGPMSIAAYMSHCLSDPRHGYYSTHTPIGASGDFITAPEVSQLFGEMVGIFLLSAWQQSGRPSSFHLVELGPGRGTLMRDILRTIASDSAAYEALEIHLVEISQSHMAQQKTTLTDVERPIIWHKTVDALPKAPIFLIANEFFDCLPIHQWVKQQDKWHERVVGLDAEGELAFGIGPIKALTLPDEAFAEQNGAIYEHSPASQAIMATLTRHLLQHKGAGLIIDYGHTNAGLGDTFQAMRGHGFADPLFACGEQDLTAHVDFSQLLECARNEIKHSTLESELHIPSPVTQADFLLGMGLLERAGQLGAGQSHADQEAIRDAVERLAAPEQMGDLFKVLALFPKNQAFPPFTIQHS